MKTKVNQLIIQADVKYLLTIWQNVILSCPRDIWTWITRSRALDPHRAAFLHLQVTARADVMNPRWDYRWKKLISPRR